MFCEKDFEDIISKYPELIENGLILKGRQITVYGRRMDLLFEDRFKRKLIVELKKGPIKDDHIGQVLSYEGMLLSADDPTIRVMLVGNRVPPNIQRSLDHHGIAWKEISFTILREFLSEKNDKEFLPLLDEPIYPGIKDHQLGVDKKELALAPEEIVACLKKSEAYQSFKRVLDQKIRNEELAREIILDNLGFLSRENLKEVISLIDEAYAYEKNGKVSKRPWFGRLLNTNVKDFFETDVNRINSWFYILTSTHIPINKKFQLLLNEQNKIKGLNVGFITLMLYLLDKSNHLIWFEGLHEGFRKIYPDMEKYNGEVSQYIAFNESARNFAQQYGFDHTELDWIFSTGVFLSDFSSESKQAMSISERGTIYEQIKDVLKNRKGQLVQRSEIIMDVQKKFGTNPSSIIPSDYCYNRINNGIKFDKHVFEYIDLSTYRYLGENFPYTGPIFHKPVGEETEKIVGEWKNGVKTLEDGALYFANLSKSKYSIDEIFERQNAILEVRKLVIEFQRTLDRFLEEKGFHWSARSHIKGFSYFSSRKKAFLFVDIWSTHFTVKYYTGNRSIEGIEKSTWINRNDMKGSKPFWITNPESVKKALLFAEAAYRIAVAESTMN